MKIRVESLSFTYPSGVRALDKINLEIATGEAVALVGENGAGKTTLVKHFNALLRSDEGKVWVGDWDVTEYSTAKLARRVGFLFQNPDEQLFERTVFRDVAFGPRNMSLPEEHILKRVSIALERVGLRDQAERHPYDLQYTDRTLVALAATLAMDTPILVLDEPTIGQDNSQRAAIGEIIRELHAGGRTIILISHDLDFCAEYTERAVVMTDGRILADGPIEEIFVQRDLLSQAALIAPQLVRLAHSLKMPRAPLNLDAFMETYSAWKRKT